jgi:hypothetical protein
MQKDMVPSGQNRFVAEKSQKEIAQKGAESAIRCAKTAPLRLGPPCLVPRPPVRVASVRVATSGGELLFRSERMMTLWIYAFLTASQAVFYRFDIVMV